MRILIAEDDDDSRTYLERTLSVHGHEVISTTNGLDALQVALDSPPDLMISDILMPQMDGYSLCRQVKSIEALKDIKVIFYTATYTGNEDVDFGLNLGASAFLIKPLDPKELIRSIDKVLSEKPNDISRDGSRLDSRELIEKHIAVLNQKVCERSDTIDNMQQALLALEHKYRDLMDISPDAIVAEEDGKIFYANNNTLDLYGFEGLNDVVDQDVAILVHPSQAEKLRQMLAEAAAGKLVQDSTDFIALHVDGTSVDVEINVGRAQGARQTAVQLAIRETTSRRRAQILEKLDTLTRRERQVLNMLVEGETNKVIARHLKISNKTVETHRANLMRKLEASSLADLIRMVKIFYQH